MRSHLMNPPRPNAWGITPGLRGTITNWQQPANSTNQRVNTQCSDLTIPDWSLAWDSVAHTYITLIGGMWYDAVSIRNLLNSQWVFQGTALRPWNDSTQHSANGWPSPVSRPSGWDNAITTLWNYTNSHGGEAYTSAVTFGIGQYGNAPGSSGNPAYAPPLVVNTPVNVPAPPAPAPSPASAPVSAPSPTPSPAPAYVTPIYDAPAPAPSPVSSPVSSPSSTPASSGGSASDVSTSPAPAPVYSNSPAPAPAPMPTPVQSIGTDNATGQDVYVWSDGSTGTVADITAALVPDVQVNGKKIDWRWLLVGLFVYKVLK